MVGTPAVAGSSGGVGPPLPAFDLGQARVVGEVTVQRPIGVAVCMPLRLVVTGSLSRNHLLSFDVGCDGVLTARGTLGCEGRGPLQFSFGQVASMTFLAWPSATATSRPHPTLLVCEWENERVQEVDVVVGAHVGFLTPEGALPCPTGVAASLRHIAVSCMKPHGMVSSHSVHLFDAVTRARLWTVGGMEGTGPGSLSCPHGLRLTADGKGVVVAEAGTRRLSLLLTADGCLSHVVPTPGLQPLDVVECEGGWLVATGNGNTVVSVPWGGGPATGTLAPSAGYGVFAVALDPALGLVVANSWGDSLKVGQRYRRCASRSRPALLTITGSGHW